MKSFLAAAIVTVAVAWGAAYVLEDRFQASATDSFTTEGVRLSN